MQYLKRLLQTVGTFLGDFVFVLGPWLFLISLVAAADAAYFHNVPAARTYFSIGWKHYLAIGLASSIVTVVYDIYQYPVHNASRMERFWYYVRYDARDFFLIIVLWPGLWFIRDRDYRRMRPKSSLAAEIKKMLIRALRTLPASLRKSRSRHRAVVPRVSRNEEDPYEGRPYLYSGEPQRQRPKMKGSRKERKLATQRALQATRR